MKRILVLTLAVAVLAGLAFAMMNRGAAPAWTTDSDAALATFEEGLELMRKFYYKGSAGKFEEALEFDPDFAAPKVLLLYTAWERKDRDDLLTDLREVDQSSLTERERFLVGFTLAKADDKPELAENILDSYLASAPEDPYALMTCSTQAWERRNWEKAQRHYKQLIESDPNWVSAQNRLGYIAMAQGQFDEAEEAFLKYQYVAPDQANPHDSMGELLALLGRYDEAQTSFERALEIQPDFCAAYKHLIDAFVLSGDFAGAAPTLERAAEHCNPKYVEDMRCSVSFWADFMRGDYDAAFAEDQQPCRKRMEETGSFILHKMATVSGRFDYAQTTETRLREMIEMFEADPLTPNIDWLRGVLLHMEGVRLAAQDQVGEAQAKMLLADDQIFYWGDSQGILKLSNLLSLSKLLRQTGDEQAADAIYEKVHAINPHFAEMVAGPAP